MFYSQIILAKKGPLSKIWIAAHVSNKLRKDDIFKTDIAQAVGYGKVSFLKCGEIEFYFLN